MDRVATYPPCLGQTTKNTVKVDRGWFARTFVGKHLTGIRVSSLFCQQGSLKEQLFY